MKKKFFVTLLIAITLIGLFTSCSNEPYKADIVQDSNRFQTVYIQNFDVGGGGIYIIVDKETNVKYMYLKSHYGSGLTKLEE